MNVSLLIAEGRTHSTALVEAVVALATPAARHIERLDAGSAPAWTHA